MASSILAYFQNIWPFLKSKTDDLKISTQLVHKLSIPEKTKHFVFALREPDSNSVVYILAAQSLSLQSALDAEYLIKEVQPKLVVAQVSPSVLPDIQAENKCLRNGDVDDVPVSYFGVLKRCFCEKINKSHYESYAGSHVLQEIFGVGFYGHFLAAKEAARETGSHFMLLESPYEKACPTTCVESDKDGDKHHGLHVQASGFLRGRITSTSYSSSKRLCCDGSLQPQTIRSVIPSLDLIISKQNLTDRDPEVQPEQDEPVSNYKVPQFAQSFYTLLVDLHDIFIELPSISKAMVSVQKMLSDINDGQPVNIRTLANVHIFRIAMEGLRVALNHSARCPLQTTENINLTISEFSKLPLEEKSHVLFVQALRGQAKKYESIVAIVDASCLAGLRRHWNTSVPLKVTELTDLSFTEYSDDDLDTNAEKMDGASKTGLLAEKPVVAVGAGATAILGVSSLTKAIPTSFVKLATSQIPATLKFGVANLQRSVAFGLGKILGSSNPVIHGLASAGTKTSTLKFTASAERIRAITHIAITSAERTSLLAMRTSFYEMMRRRGVRPFRFAPMATFGCSMVACTGLLAYGDGLECAAESLPSVPMIASLGRGLQRLHQASKEVRMTNSSKIQETSESLMHNLMKMRTH